MMFANLFKTKKTVTERAVKDVEALQCDSSITALTFARNMYKKILYECADRATLPKEIEKDIYTTTINNSYSPYKMGLIDLIVNAMIANSQVFYRKEKIKDGSYIFNRVSSYQVNTEKPDPHILELDFRNFSESKIIILLFSLLVNVLQAMSNGVQVSRALVIKINALSEMIQNAQNTEALEDQLNQLNNGITAGKTGYIDAKSSVDFAQYDPKPAQTASSFIYSLISTITGLPTSYLFSEVTGGLGDTSNSEEKRLNTSLKIYFNSICSGIFYSVFDRVFQFKQMIEDVDKLINLFSWIESTNLLTNDGVKKLLLDNTSLKRDDLNVK